MNVQVVPKILFEDANLIVVSKPSGLLSQGEHKNDPNLVDWLRDYLGRHYVGLVHRLDRNTSGVMVVAKRTKAARRLTQSLQNGELVRTYQAWIRGKLRGKQKWSHWLVKDEKKNKVSVFPDNRNPRAKKAVLEVTAVKNGRIEGEEATLAEFCLETGRSHQIRAQAAYEGHPVWGDSKYGGPVSEKKRMMRPLLHSYTIEFPHPISGEILRFKEPLPEDMQL